MSCSRQQEESELPEELRPGKTVTYGVDCAYHVLVLARARGTAVEEDRLSVVDLDAELWGLYSLISL